MEYFNKLTPPELERLALLSEELGEAQQAVGKILRHGFSSSHPDKPHETNRNALERELGDIRCAMKMMCGAVDISEGNMKAYSSRKQLSVRKYLHHQS